MPTRRAALAATAAALAAAPPRPAPAADFPSRTVTWVVPGGPGNVLDVAARLLAAKMAPRLGQGVVIDNWTGAGGTVAAEQAARAPADGHTIFYGGPSANIVVSGVKRPWKTISELAAFVRAHPGRVTYAAGVGTAQQAATMLFAEKAEVELTHVPYSVFGQIVNDLAGERVDLCFEWPVSSLPLVRGGRLRALAVNAEERLAVAPEVPTPGRSRAPGRGAALLGGGLRPGRHAAGGDRQAVGRDPGRPRRAGGEGALRQHRHHPLGGGGRAAAGVDAGRRDRADAPPVRADGAEAGLTADQRTPPSAAPSVARAGRCRMGG